MRSGRNSRNRPIGTPSGTRLGRIRIAAPAASPATSGPRRPGARWPRPPPASRAPPPARRSSAARADTGTPDCTRRAPPRRGRPARRSARRRRRSPPTSSAPNSGTTRKIASRPPSEQERRHHDRQPGGTDRHDRARHRRRRHVTGRRERQRRIRPRRLERERLGTCTPARCTGPCRDRGPALRLVHVAVGVGAAGDEGAPAHAGRRRRAASSSASATVRMSAPEPLGDEHLQRAHAVAPADLLALRARSAASNRTGSSWMRWPRRSSRAVISGSMSKRLAVSSQRPRDVGAHHLVAGLHVGERRAEEHVGHAGQHPVGGDRQPRRAGAAVQEARAVDDVASRRARSARPARPAARDRARGRRPGSRRSCRARAAGRAGSRCPCRRCARRASTVTGSRSPTTPRSTSRVPSVEPSSTTRISRATGSSIASSRSMTARDRADLVVDGNDDRQQLAAAAHRRRAGAAGAPAPAGTRASRC